MKIKASLLKELNKLGYNLIESDKKLGNDFWNIYCNGKYILKLGVEKITETKTKFDNEIYVYELNSDGENHKYYIGSSSVRKQIEALRKIQNL